MDFYGKRAKQQQADEKAQNDAQNKAWWHQQALNTIKQNNKKSTPKPQNNKGKSSGACLGVFILLLIVGVYYGKQEKASNQPANTENTTYSLSQTSWEYKASEDYNRRLLEIITEQNVVLCVNSNQIYLNCRLQKTAQNRYDLFYVKPEELGRGGVGLPWKQYSTNRRIATLTIQDDRHAYFVWEGLFNMTSGQFDWIYDADWCDANTKKRDIKLVKP